MLDVTRYVCAKRKATPYTTQSQGHEDHGHESKYKETHAEMRGSSSTTP